MSRAPLPPVPRSLRPPRGPVRAVALLALASAMAAGAGAAPLQPAPQYRVEGSAVVTIHGPGCCGDTRFTGDFAAAYELDAAGAVLSEFSFGLHDADVTVRGGFLDLFSERMSLRCLRAASTRLARGTPSGPGELKFAPGVLRLSAGAAEARLADGACAPLTLTGEAANSAELRLRHDPAGDRVTIGGAFAGTIDGEAYEMHISGEGRFTNRPPLARLAFRYLDGTWPQAGCPAFWRWNGQLWERVAEANHPAGLVAYLFSYATDPDGAWEEGDVFSERWFDTRGSGPRQPLAEGRDVGPFAFGWGTPHTVELLASDHAGAAAATACAFRVIDTRPPLVTPPPALVTGCSTAGGATAATSPALQAFLAGAAASDVADPTPTALAPRLGAADVTPTTLFPADGAARGVTFRFRDDGGNVGSAGATVTVRDVEPPLLALTVSPAALPPDLLLRTVNVTAALSDACGGPVTLRLVKIKSNAPSFDAGDIAGAAYGTDDRSFQLRGRRAAPGVPRVYTVMYEARDAAGNTRVATVKVTVG